MATHCAHCGFNNPHGMRFCGNCGARLAEATVTAPGAPFKNSLPPLSPELDPGQLGWMIGSDLKERLLAAGLEATGQRRNITVLFTDLTGYTALSEQIDPEDLYDLIQNYVRLLVNAVYKYEGIVDKIMGDGLMALFGAPITHENNAERAIRAALEMQAGIASLSLDTRQRFGVDLKMRVGLHAGPVIVGGIGSDLLMDYTAIGDTVNLAHRMEECADPGAILISEAVYRQIRPIFDCQPVSGLSPKGVTRPVAAYRVIGVKARPGQVRGLEGLHAPMIGRDHELNQLQQALAALTVNKQGQFVLVNGEAGLGKSRLITEFKATLNQEQPGQTFPDLASFGQTSIRVLEGQSQAYRRSVSYWLFQDVLYSYLGLNPSTPQLQVRERLVQNVYQSMGNQAADVLPYFEHLLSLPFSDPATPEHLRYLDSVQLRQQMFLAIRDLFLAISNHQPLLMILEDLHWADEASLELLYFLLESLLQAPIFILAVSRRMQDGLLTRITDWSQQHLGPNFYAIQLQNLSQDESERLLSQLLSITSLPDSLREQILQRAAGIPLYLEEILRMLIDQGALRRQEDGWRLAAQSDEVISGVPDTLQGLILARFDRLETSQRRLLQAASVIGKTFSLTVLEAVLQPAGAKEFQAEIAALIERVFIQPVTGEMDSELTFRHILMSDAIYSTLLRRDRARLHGLVGEAIETLYAERLELQIEILANHYRSSTQLDKALHYSLQAGQKAARNNINEQARQHYQSALKILPQVRHIPYQAFQAQMGLGDVLVFSGEYPAARQHFQAALVEIASQEAGEYLEEHSCLYRKIARTYERQGDYDQALYHLKKAQQFLDEAPVQLPVDLAQVWNDFGWILFQKGNFAEAQQRMQAALNLVEGSDSFDTIASIYNRLGGVAYNLGDWDGAAGFLRKSIAIRESIRDEVGLATSFNNLGLLEIEMGELDNALENLTRGFRLKKRLGQADGIAMSLNNLGWLHIQRGELDEAGRVLGEALQLARRIGYSSLLRQILTNFGELHVAAHEWEEARRVLDEARTALNELRAYGQLLDNYRLLGEAALGSGDIHSAQVWEKKARELLEMTGPDSDSHSSIQIGEFRRFQGMLAVRLSDWESASKFLQESERIFQKLRSRLHQGRVAYQYGAMAEAQGDRRNAGMRFREAVLLFQSIGARLEAQRSEEAFKRQ